MDIKFPSLQFLFLCFLLIGPYGQTETLPLEYFLRGGDYLNLKISPDGKHFAARIRKDDRVVLAFLNRKTGAMVGGVQRGSENEVHSVRWVNNERVVYELAEKYRGEREVRTTGELYAVNIDNSKHERIFGFQAGDKTVSSRISVKESDWASAEIVSLLKGDSKHIVIVEYPWRQKGNWWYDYRDTWPTVSKLNVYSGKKKKIETLPYPGARVVVDDKAQVRFATWTDKQGRIHSVYKENKKSEWQEISEFLNKPPSSFKPLSVDNLQQKAYFTGAIGPDLYRTIFELDLNSKQFRPIFSELNADVETYYFDLDGRAPAVGVSYASKYQYHYPENFLPVSKIHKSLARAFQGKMLEITSHTDNGKIVLVRISSDINPGEYFLYDRESKQADRVLINRSWVDPEKMRPTQAFVVTARDGIQIPAYLTMPVEREGADKKVPMLVLLHGGPHGVRDYWGFNSQLQLIANRGYAVLQINYRGSAGYGEVFKEAGYKQWGGKIINDILDVTQHVLNEQPVDAEKVCIYGASFGAYAALMSASIASERFRCVAGFAGIYDLKMIYEKGDIPDIWGGKEYLQRAIGTDESVLARFSPVNLVENIKIPVLLIHGDEDQRAPINHAHSLKKKLESAQKDVDLLVLKNTGHGSHDYDINYLIFSRLLAFLDKNTQ